MYNNGCELGCQMFDGGEIKHHKHCMYYPDSRTKMYDDLKVEYDNLKIENEKLNKKLSSLSDAWKRS